MRVEEREAPQASFPFASYPLPLLAGMVLFFTSTAVSPPCFIYMGRDKVESASCLRPPAGRS